MIDIGPVNHIMDRVAEFAGVPKKEKMKKVLHDLQYALKWMDMPDDEKRDRIQWRNQNKNLDLAMVLECLEFDLPVKRGGCWYGKKRPRNTLSI